MTWPEWTDIAGILTPLGLACGWWIKRRDTVGQLRRDLATVTDASAKAQRAHEEALAAKNAELTELRRALEIANQRIEELKDQRIEDLRNAIQRGGFSR